MDNTQNQTLQIPPEILTFIETLLNDAKITPIDGDMKQELINQIYVKLDNFITTSIIDNLPPEHLEEFMKMNEENRPRAEIDAFMSQKIPNSQEVFAKAFLDFRDLYLGNTTN